MKKFLNFGLLLMSLLVFTGCDKVKEIQQVQQGLDTINDAKQTIQDGKETVEKLQNDVNSKIEQGKELKKQFDEFSNALDTFTGDKE